MLDLTPYLDRKPKQLSGGQRQRVAMGRAIVREPKVFLMDEPLSNLDAKLRVQMRGEIARLQYELGTTTIYVTHDQVEAMTMGHRVAVMNAGVLQQIDTPQRLYDAPANVFVAGFIGTPPMNLFVAAVSVADGAVELAIGSQRVRLGDAASSATAASWLRGRQHRRGHPQRGHVPRRDPARAPSLTARLLNVEALGSETIAFLRIDAESIGSVAADDELLEQPARRRRASSPRGRTSSPRSRPG